MIEEKKEYYPEPSRNGSVNLKRVDIIIKDGEEISRTNHRQILKPNDDISSFPQDVQDVCQSWWTHHKGEPPTQEEIEKQIKQRINEEAEQVMKEIKEEILQEMLNQVYAEKESLTDEQVLAEPKKVKPFKIGTDYKTGDRFYYPRNKKLYKVLQPHKSAVQWLPNEAVSLYVEVAPEGAIADWVQPTDATNAYNTGEKVNYKGQVWISKIDANTTVPDGDVPHNRYWEPFTG